MNIDKMDVEVTFRIRELQSLLMFLRKSNLPQHRQKYYGLPSGVLTDIDNMTRVLEHGLLMSEAL